MTLISLSTMTIHNASRLFIKHCIEERQLSANTISAYLQDLATFSSLIGTNASITSISGATLLHYRNTLECQRASPATIKRRIACIKNWFRWMKRQRITRTDPFETLEIRIRLPERLPRSLTSSEVRTLLMQLRSMEPAIQLGFSLMLATGMRIGELTAVKCEDVRGDCGSIRIIGKGNRERTAFVTDAEIRKSLFTTLGSRSMGHLMIDKSGRHLSAQRIRAHIVRLGKQANLGRRLTPHMLRHTAATLMLEHGIDVRMIQKLLGHRSITTTVLYTHVTDAALLGALTRADVIRRLRPVNVIHN